MAVFGYALSRYYIDVPNWLYVLFSVPIGILFFLFTTALLYDIAHSLLLKLPISTTRRDFFKHSLDVSSLAFASTLTARSLYEARYIETQKVNISLKNLQKEYKLVQISDIHIGGLIDASFIKNIVQRVNDLKPDLVIISGDLVDTTISKATAALQELLALRSVYGTYYTLGNHEYFHDVDEILMHVKSLGIKVLENENTYIGEKNRGFNLAGVHDMFGYRVKHHQPDLQKALLSRDTTSPTLLIAHQPKFLEEANNKVDLMLSGHTHGGQLYPFGLLVGLQQPYIRGLHQHSQKTQIYVNKGTGYWGPPMRLGATAEITLITLKQV